MVDHLSISFLVEWYCPKSKRKRTLCFVFFAVFVPQHSSSPTRLGARHLKQQHTKLKGRAIDGGIAIRFFWMAGFFLTGFGFLLADQSNTYFTRHSWLICGDRMSHTLAQNEVTIK